jgi:hypothetical protein
MALRRLEQRPQAVAIALLVERACGERPPGGGGAVDELVADLLQLAEVEQPRRRGDGGDVMRNGDAPEPLADQRAQLTLEPADLRAQLRTRGQLPVRVPYPRQLSTQKLLHGLWRV